MVEMALVVTVLLGLSLGLIQYAVLANARMSLTNLAREGARFSALHATVPGSDTSTDPTQGIKRFVVSVAQSTPLKNITGSNVTVSPPEGDAARVIGQPITVTVSYDMTSKFILPSTFPGLSRFGTNTTASATMLIQN